MSSRSPYALAALLVAGVLPSLACSKKGDGGASTSAAASSSVQSIAPVSAEVTIDTPAGTLAGVFDVPAGNGVYPAVLIIAGSGPTDRDGNTIVPGATVRNDSLKLLAQALVSRGIATLRFDKRGIGASKGVATKEEELRIDTFADDATQWVALLRRSQHVGKIALVGHGEGALIAVLAAKSAKVDAMVSIAGAGRPADVVLREQLATKINGDLLAKADHLIDELKGGHIDPEPPPELRAMFRPGVQPYVISWMRYDPASQLGELTMPTLIVQGTNDLQASEQDARRLASARPDAKLVMIDGMNHVLKIVAGTTVDAQQRSYMDPSLPIAPKLVDEIATFVGSLR